MPAPNGPCDIVVLDFLTVTHIITAVSQYQQNAFFYIISLQENTQTHTNMHMHTCKKALLSVMDLNVRLKKYL